MERNRNGDRAEQEGAAVTHPEIAPLESKLQELEAHIATARIKGQVSDVNRLSAMAGDCRKMLADAYVLQHIKDVENFE